MVLLRSWPFLHKLKIHYLCGARLNFAVSACSVLPKRTQPLKGMPLLAFLRDFKLTTLEKRRSLRTWGENFSWKNLMTSTNQSAVSSAFHPCLSRLAWLALESSPFFVVKILFVNLKPSVSRHEPSRERLALQCGVAEEKTNNQSLKKVILESKYYIIYFVM